MKIAVSIGNTSTRICALGTSIEQIAAFPSTYQNHSALAGSIAQATQSKDGGIVVVSVVPVLDRIWKKVHRGASSTRLLFLNASAIKGKKLPLKIRYHSPTTLGADRMANALGAVKRFPKKDRIIVDIGTAITVDYVSSRNEFKGGVIFSGIDCGLNALGRKTGLLPQLKYSEIRKPLGTDTPSCMNLGAKYQALGGIHFAIRSIKQNYKLKNPVLIATGGGCDILNSQTDLKPAIIPELLFIGAASLA